jgi:hypothetical protein
MADKTAYRYALVGIGAALGLFLIGASVIAAVGHTVPAELWTVGTALGGGLLGVLVPSPKATLPTPGVKAAAELHAVQDALKEATAHAALGTARPGWPGQAGTVTASLPAAVSEAVRHVRVTANPEQATDVVANGLAGDSVLQTLAKEYEAQAAQFGAPGESPGLAVGTPAVAPTPAERAAAAHVYRAAAKALRKPKTARLAEGAAKSAPDGQAQNKDYFTKLGPPTVVFVVALALGTLLSVGTFHPRHAFVQTTLHEGTALIALAIAAGGSVVGVLAPSPGQKPANAG